MGDLTRFYISIFSIVSFFGMAGGALLGPVLPIMVEPLNATREAVGWVMAIYTLSTAVFMLYFGTITDSIGRKKILVPCLLINGIAGFACYLAPNLGILLILRFIQGIGIAGMIPIAMTMIGELYDEVDRIHAMGRISVTTSIGAISAPFIGGSMALVSWNYPFLFYMLTIPLAVLAYYILPETNIEPQEKKITFKRMFSVLRNINVFYVMFLCFMSFFLLYTIVIYVPFILIEKFNFTSMGAGIAIGLQGISMIIVASKAKKLALAYSFTKIILFGFLFISIAIFGIGILPELYMIYFFLLMFGVGFGMTQPLLSASITVVAPSNMMGSTVLIYNTMKYAGQTASPAVFGVILAAINFSGVFLVSSILGLCVVISALYMRKDLVGLDGNSTKNM